MFTSPTSEHSLPKSEYKAQLPALRQKLITIQQALRDKKFPVVVLLSGVDGAGKSEIVNLLNTWFDPRWLRTQAYVAPSEEERQRPVMWRYWRDLPPKGQIGLFVSSWYSQPLVHAVHGTITQAEYRSRLDHINAFENTLRDDGALVLKFWLHLDKADQKKHFDQLEADPDTAWQVSPKDWQNYARYDDFVREAETLIRETKEWQIVQGKDLHYSSLAIANAIHDAIEAHNPESNSDNNWQAPNEPHLGKVDLSQTLPKKTYKEELKIYQGRLNRLQREANRRGISTVLMFEGWDAAGKGGAIRRITGAMDARQYQVIPVAAPTEEEFAQHYLWRFWRHLSRAGRVTIFDRSWYGRVLVERIEGFAKNHEWQRAYDEINAFEAELTDHGIILGKFWIHISNDEQERRFADRAKTPHKAWKLTDEDWRNREKWGDYVEAVDDLVELTDQPNARWHLVAGENKYFARIQVLRAMCVLYEQSLD